MNEERATIKESKAQFKAAIQRLEDLECYNQAREFRKQVSVLCRDFPKEETFRLKDQLLRSSRSISANIAEGYGRHHHQENLQFCRQARGSLTESIDHLNCALDEQYINDSKYAGLREHANTLLKILNGYIAYLRSAAHVARGK